MEIIAHRGFSAAFPENTELAFREAAAFPIWGLELDVQLTRDHEIVICHDATVDRTSNGRGAITDLSLRRLREFNFYGQFPRKACSETRIWTLAEFCDWFRGTTRQRVNIELKPTLTDYRELCDAVADVIRQFHLERRVLISSFHHPSVITMRELLPEVETAFLTGAALFQPERYLSAYGIGHYHPDYHMTDAETVERCHREDIEVNAYTVNTYNDMTQAEARGIDRIFTNEVAKAVAFVRQAQVHEA